jgi:tetratricopeptide (TPR) repeat protein
MKANTLLQLPSIFGLVLLCVFVLVMGALFLVGPQKYAEYYYSQGVDHHSSGDLELAVDDYTKAIKLNPDYVEAYHKRGDACFGMGEWELAVQDYRRYLQLSPYASDRAEVTIRIDKLKTKLSP